MPAGATSETTMRSHVGIVSLVWKGYAMVRSTGEKGRWWGSTYSHPPPTAAIALFASQFWVSFVIARDCSDRDTV